MKVTALRRSKGPGRRDDPEPGRYPESSVQRRARPRPLPAARSRIALVTVDPGTLDRHVRALEEFCEVEVVLSGTAAIELVLVDRGIELVICTHAMPDLTACQFLQNLSWMMPAHPPVVVVGENDPVEKDRAMALGASACFSARCGARMFSSRVERLLCAQSG